MGALLRDKGAARGGGGGTACEGEPLSPEERRAAALLREHRAALPATPQRAAEHGGLLKVPRRAAPRRRRARLRSDAGPTCDLQAALAFRFPTVFDAWAFLDADGGWDCSRAEFLRLGERLRLHLEARPLTRPPARPRAGP